MIFYLFRQSWKIFVLAIVAGLIGGGSSASLSILIGKAISGTLELPRGAWMFFFLCTTAVLARCCSEITLTYLSQNTIARLRVDLSRRMIGTPLTQLQSLGSAELLVMLTSDINRFVSSFQALPVVFCNVVTLLVCFGYMTWISWQLTIFFACVLLIGTFVYRFAERYPLESMKRFREQSRSIYQHFKTLIDAGKELKMNSRRASVFIEDHIVASTSVTRRLYIKATNGYIWLGNIGSIVFYLVVGIELFVAPLVFPQSRNTITSFTIILLSIIGPVGELLGTIPGVRQAHISLNKIMKLGELLATTQAAPLTVDPFASDDALRIELKDVRHRYEGDMENGRFMLGPVDLTIREGDIVFITGGNGSGKTTLAMLLLGLYEALDGTIALNGVRVDASNVEAYRQHFSVIFSDAHVFDWLDSADRHSLTERARYYIDRLDMADKVEVSDGKFTSVDLSTGQRKRLALISAYLENRKIYFFDEWAANQDPDFKRVFYMELLPELKRTAKTVIAITHDDRFFDCADLLVKLEDGAVRSVVRNRASAHEEIASKSA
jgi:putative pyoverdin transport system ATP-binding/permease protein